MPKVSFVVPLHNKEAFIHSTIKCLLAQTLKDIEIVVVNDKSTDDSLELVKAFKDKRIRIFDLPENKGRSYARNFGNAKARSAIICVNDADDISHKERARVVYEYFKKNKVDVFYSGFAMCDDSDVVRQMIGVTAFDKDIVRRSGYTYICHSTMAYKKKIGVKYSLGKFSDLGIDDWKFQLDLLSKGYKFGNCEKPLVIYRNSKQGISNNRDEREVKRVKVKAYKEMFNEDALFTD